MEYFATFNASAVYTDQQSGEVHKTPIPFGRLDLADYPELHGFTRDFVNVQQREPRSRMTPAAVASGESAANPSPIIDEADLELRRLTRLVEQVHERKERLRNEKMRKLRATTQTNVEQSETGEVVDDEASTTPQADAATTTVDDSEPGNV